MGKSEFDSPQYMRQRIRREVLKDIRRIVNAGAEISNEKDARGQHLFVLTDYQIANLREFLYATGYGSVYKSPINVAHNGDWVGEILHMVNDVETEIKPNATAEELTKYANDWKQNG